MIAQNSNTATACIRRLLPVARRHNVNQPSTFLATKLLVLAPYALLTALAFASPKIVHIPADGGPVIRQHHDTDRPKRQPKKARPAEAVAPRPRGISKVQECSEADTCDISAPDEYQPQQ